MTVETLNSGLEIMVVDDTPESLKLLTDLLSSEGYGVRPSNDPVMALESAFTEPPDLILLDVRMPGMNGFEVCQHLKQETCTKDVPVLFVSASDDIEDHVQGFRVGGVDYIAKPINKDEVLARVKTHLELYRIKKNLEVLVNERTEQLFESRERLRALSDHLQKVREQEKTHLSRELHDELGGTLTAIRLDVAWLKQMDKDNHVELDGKVNGILDMVDSVISVTRRIVSELRPVLLDEIGLWAAIEWQLKEFEKRTKIDCAIISECNTCEIQGRCDKNVFTPEISITMYRLFQEALTNISRHASATQVEVGCCLCDNSAVLTIKDNGVGFDSSIIDNRNSYGIRGMYERVGSLGGTLSIESKLNFGTTVEAKLPLNRE